MSPTCDFPNFDEAVVALQRFLTDQGHPHNELFWVFRDDVWIISPSKLRVRYPVSRDNRILAQKVFDEGSKRGLVDVHAVATANGKVAATVWFPKFPEEEVQGWDRGMKLSIANPLLEAEAVSRFRWSLLTFVPDFRQFQKSYSFIGTKAWAAA